LQDEGKRDWKYSPRSTPLRITRDLSKKRSDNEVMYCEILKTQAKTKIKQNFLYLQNQYQESKQQTQNLM